MKKRKKPKFTCATWLIIIPNNRTQHDKYIPNTYSTPLTISFGRLWSNTCYYQRPAAAGLVSGEPLQCI